MRIATAVNIAELRGLARRRLPRVVFDYLDSGTEDEITGVAAAGEAGVDRALEILREETHRVLTLLGCPTLQALSGECLREVQAPVPHG